MDVDQIIRLITEEGYSKFLIILFRQNATDPGVLDYHFDSANMDEDELESFFQQMVTNQEAETTH